MFVVMEDTSRSEVTITLGRSGQVVKRSGAVLDSKSFGSVPAVGSKRSVRDRLGSSVDASHLDNKRHHRVDGGLSFKTSNGVDDTHLGKDDLRFKILKKTQGNGQQKRLDLRDTLSRKPPPSSTNQRTHQSLPEPRYGRQRSPDLTPEPRNTGQRPPQLISELRNGGQRAPQFTSESRNGGQRPPQFTPESRNGGQRPPQFTPESRNGGQRAPQFTSESRNGGQRGMPEPRDDQWHVTELRGEREHMSEPWEGRRVVMHEPIEVEKRILKLNDSTNGSMLGRYTSTRTSEAVSHMDMSRNSYSPWAMDHVRARSPNRVLDNSRGQSPPPPLPPPPPPPLPPPRAEEPQRMAIMRSYNDPRGVPYGNMDVQMPMVTASFPGKPGQPVGPMVNFQLPPGPIVQQTQYPIEHLTVESFLHSLGLQKYMISFRVEEVDMASLTQMGDHDLRELGIPMGPRKKILLALSARARRQASMSHT